MRVAIGSDDAGFPLKEVIRAYLQDRGVEMRDFGVSSAAPSDIDYPDVARAVAEAVASGQEERAIIVDLGNATRKEVLLRWETTRNGTTIFDRLQSPPCAGVAP